MNTTVLSDAFKSIESLIPFKPALAIVLGSGLGALADELESPVYIDYSEISGFPVSTAPGHRGRYAFGLLNGVPVVIMQGRVHYYEGYSTEQVVLPIRLMRLMGAQMLLLTNASGGINHSFCAGDFMLITDQISSFAPSPLIGKNDDGLGVRFPDMSEVYSKRLRGLALEAAEELDIKLKQGIYVQTTGPNYESPAEIRMFRTLGADAVGMSTVCEAIAARHCGMEICGISCIANLACGMTDNPLTEEEVLETAAVAAPQFKALVRAFAKKISMI